MARRRNRSNIVPQAGKGMDLFKAQVMKNQGYAVNPERPDDVKYEVAKSLGVPLQPGYNGHLSTEQAGKVGGQIGGSMVREMVRMAQEQLARKENRR